ncbi:hypothetical protein GLOIN_2v1869233 [Rhizophagus clarus]|uniref:SbsA Ig-like domain-containing protein n=1 Tax=Rhizophagus clarus TaxID=94130 RepID=A0A8H3LP14_9GLOM|nr:hypothetical protein GLOIN_2v1869233 [Rhizophagus clarus]
MKLKHLLIFLSLIIFATLPVNSNFITYIERETTRFKIGKILNYGDNTIVLQIVRNSSVANCYETSISLRVIYSNGTITSIDLSMEELGIQSFNFCIVNSAVGPLNPIILYNIETKENKFILVTYTEAVDANNPFTYNDYIMLIDLNGKIYSKTLMGPSLVDTTNNNTWMPQQFDVAQNVNNEQGFLYLTFLSSSFNNTVISYFNFTQWIINEDGTLSNVTEAMVLSFQKQPVSVSTVDGGYMLIYFNMTTSQDPFTPQTWIYAMYCGYGSNTVRDPVILYETTTELTITHLDCVISNSEVGQICLIATQSNSTDPNAAPIYIKVNYLSGGSVFNVNHIEATPPTIIGTIEFDSSQFTILPLQFGGYYYSVNQPTNINDDQSQYNTWGYVLNDNGNLIQWNLPYPTQTDSHATSTALTNNTLVLVQPIVGQSWSLITTDLYKIHEDKGYQNIQITNTYPPIGQSISVRETNPLTITYAVPIVLSNGTITIFQSNGSSNPGIVRQTINGLNNQEYVTINNNTVSVTIIESTFNNPGSTYYVMIENTFVSSQLYNEPLPGLSNNIWHFTTFPEEEKAKQNKIKMFFDSIYGEVRLTKDGSTYFEKLNPDQKNKFFDNLTQDLANAVVVATNRITTNYKYVIDTESSNIDSSSKQYLLSIKIEKPQVASDRETDLIVKDFKVMIQNMDINDLASGNSSKYLESIYGFVTIPRWYENPDYIFQFILTLIFFLILTVLCLGSIYYDARIEVKSGANNISANNSVTKTYFRILKRDITELIQTLNLFSRKKEKELVDEDKINHFKIYFFGFNVLSFVLDILFAKIEAVSVKNIFFASVFFVTVPYVIKLGYAVYIILNELVRKENSEDTAKLLNELVEEEKALGDSNDKQDGLQVQDDDSQDQQEGSQEQQVKAKEKVPIKEWLEKSKDHKISLVLLISLAGTDIGALEIFYFRFCKYKINVELSKEFKERIIIGEILGIVIKNMPDLAIRVYFLSKAIDFSYLSTLTLLVTIIKILGLFLKPMKLKNIKGKNKKNYDS